MTRLSKQARRRAQSPRKRKSRHQIQHPPVAPHLPFKAHENAAADASVFIPKIS